MLDANQSASRHELRASGSKQAVQAAGAAVPWQSTHDVSHMYPYTFRSAISRSCLALPGSRSSPSNRCPENLDLDHQIAATSQMAIMYSHTYSSTGDLLAHLHRFHNTGHAVREGSVAEVYVTQRTQGPHQCRKSIRLLLRMVRCGRAQVHQQRLP